MLRLNKDLSNVRQVLVNTYHSPWAWPWHSDLQGGWIRGGGGTALCVDIGFYVDISPRNPDVAVKLKSELINNFF